MKQVSEFVANLNEVFAQFGAIEAKRMFGGYGIFRAGTMFALVADDELFLKADAVSSGVFVEQGLAPFTYQKGGRPMTMSYYRAPEGIFDDPALARDWANRAFDAALRAHANKKPRRGD